MYQKLTRNHIINLAFIFETKNQKHKRNINLTKYNVFEDYDKIIELKTAIETNKNLRRLKNNLRKLQ
jgi:hypothetical protein